MTRSEDSPHAEDIGPAHPASGAKRPYEAPELIEWGSIVELTYGKKSGTQDLPKTAGGTKGV